MDGNAIILTAGILNSPNAKTAHGLIRATSRYHITAVIDHQHAGRDAGEVLDGIRRNIPIYATIDEFLAQHGEKASFCIVGVATHGGLLPDSLIEELSQALEAGMSLVSGLHHFMCDNPRLAESAARKGLQLIDVRKPKSREELHFWSGEIYEVKCPIIAVLGTDCALGKRTTTLMLTQALQQKGYNAHMIYTGQTGWLQGLKYGFVFDSTLNDFVCGEFEHAIVSCYRNEQPDIMLLEGQASLLNPSGPCGSEYLISANARHVILQHAPGRKYVEGWEEAGLEIPPVSRFVELINLYGSRVIGMALNTSGLSPEEALAAKTAYEQEFGVPVSLPVSQGVDELLTAIEALRATYPAA